MMHCVGRFDNSADNPNNPDPTRLVTFGEQTNDEMFIGYIDVAQRPQRGPARGCMVAEFLEQSTRLSSLVMPE